MKKVLIFYGSYGGGHLSAARNIKEYIDTNYEGTETLLVDCIEYANKVLNKVTTKAFEEMTKNVGWAWKTLYENADKRNFNTITTTANKLLAIKINKLIHEFNPDLIISTHPFSTQICSILKKKSKIDCKIGTIITDYAPHSEWITNSEYLEYFFVAHEGMKTNLITRGVEADKIHVTGIPLSTKFLANYDKSKILSDFNLSPNKKTILFFAGRS